MGAQSLVFAFISLGSNEGDLRANLAEARKAVAGIPGVRVAAASSVYDTEPQGYADQPWFANQVLKLACAGELSPQALLERLLHIEQEMGRVRSSEPALRFGPRTIDLDLLLMGEARLTTDRLTLPHPRLHERAFVLVPLLELEPDLCLPDGSSVREHLHHLPHTLDGTHIHQ